MATDTKLDGLVINYLTQSQYDNAKSAGTLDENQIYMTPASNGSSYILPMASSDTLGGVKIGNHINRDVTGSIYLSEADFDTFGVVKLGSNISRAVKDGTISVATGSTSTLGVLKVGSNITVSSGTISLTKANVTSALGYTPPTTDTKYTLPTGNASTLGGVKLSDSTSSTSSTSGGIAATPKAVKDAYDASTEWVDVSSSSIITVSSSAGVQSGDKIYRRGKTYYWHFTAAGAATSGTSGIISVGTVASAYRPAVTMTCAVAINITTSGQVFGSATCLIKSSGEIQVVTGQNSKTFGNNSYSWATNNGMTITWQAK